MSTPDNRSQPRSLGGPSSHHVAVDAQRELSRRPAFSLRVLDPDTTISQIDMTPEQPAELFDAKSGQDQRGDDRAAIGASEM